MKSLLLSTSASTNSSYLTYPFAVAPLIRIAIWLLLGLPFYVACQTDNFDDGDAVGWSGITATNFPANNSFPSDSFGGKAYRTQGTPRGTVATAILPCRGLSRRPELHETFTWPPASLHGIRPSPTTRLSALWPARTMLIPGFGMRRSSYARMNRFHSTSTSSSRGQVYIYNLVNGTTPNNAAAAAAECTLVAGHQYRFVFMGRERRGERLLYRAYLRPRRFDPPSGVFEWRQCPVHPFPMPLAFLRVFRGVQLQPGDQSR